MNEGLNEANILCEETPTALEVFLAVYDQEHPLVADSKYNLAILHKRRKETEMARQLFLECEQIYSAVYGPDHNETQDAARQASRCE